MHKGYVPCSFNRTGLPDEREVLFDAIDVAGGKIKDEYLDEEIGRYRVYTCSGNVFCYNVREEILLGRELPESREGFLRLTGLEKRGRRIFGCVSDNLVQSGVWFEFDPLKVRDWDVGEEDE